jgi:DNA-binding response OmpR family regulator
MPLAYALQEAGFAVVSAADGADALSVLQDPSIAGAIIDVHLPGHLDGLSALREARRQKPALKAIITSGFPADREAASLGPFLGKPFRADQLIDALRSLIDDDPSAPDARRARDAGE